MEKRLLLVCAGPENGTAAFFLGRHNPGFCQIRVALRFAVGEVHLREFWCFGEDLFATVGEKYERVLGFDPGS